MVAPGTGVGNEATINGETNAGNDEDKAKRVVAKMTVTKMMKARKTTRERRRITSSGDCRE